MGWKRSRGLLCAGDDVHVAQNSGARVENVVLGMGRAVDGVVGFDGERRLAVEEHGALAFEHDEDLFVVLCAVLADGLIGLEDNEAGAHGDAFGRSGEQGEIVFAVGVELDNFCGGRGWLRGERGDGGEEKDGGEDRQGWNAHGKSPLC